MKKTTLTDLEKISKGDLKMLQSISKYKRSALTDMNDEQEVNLENIKTVLNYYFNNQISLQDLVDWVNLIWFSDNFTYKENEKETISECLFYLEQLDEAQEVNDLLLKVKKILG